MVRPPHRDTGGDIPNIYKTIPFSPTNLLQALFVGYLLTFLWLIINGALVLLTIFSLMVWRYEDFLAQNGTTNACIDLAYYGR